MGTVHSYSQLITYGFFIGMGLTSFLSVLALSAMVFRGEAEFGSRRLRSRKYWPIPGRIQLWLLTVSMEALLSGAIRTLVPAVAAVLVFVNAGLLRYVFHFDRRIRSSK
jgi:hypothetical protein